MKFSAAILFSAFVTAQAVSRKALQQKKDAAAAAEAAANVKDVPEGHILISKKVTWPSNERPPLEGGPLVEIMIPELARRVLKERKQRKVRTLRGGNNGGGKSGGKTASADPHGLLFLSVDDDEDFTMTTLINGEFNFVAGDGDRFDIPQCGPAVFQDLLPIGGGGNADTLQKNPDGPITSCEGAYDAAVKAPINEEGCTELVMTTGTINFQEFDFACPSTQRGTWTTIECILTPETPAAPETCADIEVDNQGPRVFLRTPSASTNILGTFTCCPLFDLTAFEEEATGKSGKNGNGRRRM